MADAPSGDKRLPLICEAYFAKLSQCIRASVSRHPDEATKAEVQKRFEKAEQTSRALMTAAMEPKDAEAYCRQALLALTASPCE